MQRTAGEQEIYPLHRVENDADVTLRGLEGELGGRGLTVDHATVGRFLHRKGQSFKKNRVRGRTEAAQPFAASTFSMAGLSRQDRSAPSGFSR